jgi:AcrR family transcriptional regulator
MQKRSLETRNLIFRVALDLFSQMGYEATSVAEICQAAGVSKGAFYHHFATKQALFMELLDSWLELLEMQIKEIQKEAQDVPQAILNMAGLLEQVFQQASGRLPMFLEFWTQASHDPLVWQAIIAPYQRYQAHFKELIEKGIAEGSINYKNSEAASRALVAMGVGLLLMGVLEPRVESESRIPTESIKILLNGLAMERA